jgi:hypothetical protein
MAGDAHEVVSVRKWVTGPEVSPASFPQEHETDERPVPGEPVRSPAGHRGAKRARDNDDDQRSERSSTQGRKAIVSGERTVRTVFSMGIVNTSPSDGPPETAAQGTVGVRSVQRPFKDPRARTLP